MHLSMLSPRVGGGGGGGDGKLTERAFPWVGILTFSVAPGGREFDMAAILEDREKLEMSDLPS